MQSFHEFCQALRLVHDRYSASGFMQPKPSGFRIYLRDLLPTSIVFVAVEQGRVFGTTSANLYLPGSIPLAKLFPKELSDLVRTGAIAAEGTKLACAHITADEPRIHGGLGVTAIALLNLIYGWCVKSGVTDWLIVVHPRVRRFYEEDLGFKAIAELETCAHVANNPGVLLALDVSALKSGERKPTKIAEEIFSISCPLRLVTPDSYQLSDEEVGLLLLDDLEIISTAPVGDISALLRSYPTLTKIIATQIGVIRHRFSETLQPRLASSCVRLLSTPKGIVCAKNLEFVPECFALRGLLEKLRILIELILSKKNIAFDISIDDSIPDSILADSALLSKLLITCAKLISVADRQTGHATESPGWVKLHISWKAGMDDQLDLILHLVSAFKISTKDLRHVAEAMAAKLTKYKNRSAGLEFTCIVPAMKISLAPHLMLTSATNKLSPSALNSLESKLSQIKFTILIIEDNLVNQVIMRRLLERLGISVDIAKDGVEGLNKYNLNSYNLILMDIQLPKLDGLSLTKMIREQEANSNIYTPIYAMTSFVMNGDEIRCKEAGVDGYLPKPINCEELYKVLFKLISDQESTLISGSMESKLRDVGT